MKKTKYIFGFIFACALMQAATAQEVVLKNPAPTKTPAFTVEVAYGTHLPGGDLGKRFGLSQCVSGGVHYLTDKLWKFGVDGGYFFGYNVLEDPIANLRTPDGAVLGKDREYAPIQIDERGFYFGGYGGKIIPLSAKLPNAGIRISLSAGYLHIGGRSRARNRLQAQGLARCCP